MSITKNAYSNPEHEKIRQSKKRKIQKAKRKLKKSEIVNPDIAEVMRRLTDPSNLSPEEVLRKYKQ